ncbi:metal-dependent hydrolase [Chitinimonas sp.]|uniref:metal-dependent hydrolase n=1 Tax=Chitinimonas sp. TaxID=1934313 RepID=UPI002F91C60D
MPTIISHAAVPLALGLGLGRRWISPRLLLAGVVLAMLPDLDVLSFKLGVAYGDALGHRGFSHALLTAALCAAGLSGVARYLGARLWMCWLFLFVAMASHGLLDTLTNGGHGVALLWPWSDTRWFAPWRPIEVSPIGFSFLSLRGLVVLASELLWIWLPAWVVMLCLCAWLPEAKPWQTAQA